MNALENRTAKLEAQTGVGMPTRILFAIDPATAQAQLAAMPPSEREGVMMISWLPAQPDPKIAKAPQ